MIYNKEVAFPYPVLMTGYGNYKDDNFDFDVLGVTENIDEFNFSYEFEISSDFIKSLLINKKAKAVLIIRSKDNKFYILDTPAQENDKFYGEQTISKKRLSLIKEKTRLQIFIQSSETINYSGNDDLVEFFDTIKNEIVVDKNAVIAISSEVVFDKESRKDPELFEKAIDENLKSEIGIELTSDVIVIKYKNSDFQFQTINFSKELNYPYIYMGLQKALYRLIIDINSQLENDLDETINISELNSDDYEGLNYKLLSLMQNKGVRELNFDKIDEAIYKISDKIIEKYAKVIKRISEDGN